MAAMADSENASFKSSMARALVTFSTYRARRGRAPRASAGAAKSDMDNPETVEASVFPGAKQTTVRTWMEETLFSEHHKCKTRIEAVENMIAQLNNKETKDLTIAIVKEMFPNVPTINFIAFFESDMTRADLTHILRTLDVYFGLKDEQIDEYYMTEPAKVIAVFMKMVIEQNGVLPDGVYMMVATTGAVPLFFLKVGTVDTIIYSVNILKATAYDFVNHKFMNMLADIDPAVFAESHMPQLIELYKFSKDQAIAAQDTKITEGEIEHMLRIEAEEEACQKLEQEHGIEARRAKHEEIMARKRERQQARLKNSKGKGLGFSKSGMHALTVAEEPNVLPPVAVISEVGAAEMAMAAGTGASSSDNPFDKASQDL